ncbi:hypothetical protein TNCV_2377441 [Trichonephila clavipes]|nr:hypothetical protein TNCV_2377441 [Trichonephila clavipes]
MRPGAYCAHSSIRDHWALRCMSRCPEQVVSLKRDSQCLSPQESLVLIYPPTALKPRVQGGWRIFPSPPVLCLNCGGGDQWCRHLSSLREFQRAKSYCHLYGAQGLLSRGKAPSAAWREKGIAPSSACCRWNGIQAGGMKSPGRKS